jgi:hypothetical protein
MSSPVQNAPSWTILGSIGQSANGPTFGSLYSTRGPKEVADPVPEATVIGLKELAKNRNADATEILMQYTCHIQPETRKAAVAALLELFPSNPREIGEMAANFGKSNDCLKDTRGDDEARKCYPGINFVSFICIAGEMKLRKTGEHYGAALDRLAKLSGKTKDAIVCDVDVFLKSNEFPAWAGGQPEKEERRSSPTTPAVAAASCTSQEDLKRASTSLSKREIVWQVPTQAITTTNLALVPHSQSQDYGEMKLASVENAVGRPGDEAISLAARKTSTATLTEKTIKLLDPKPTAPASSHETLVALQPDDTAAVQIGVNPAVAGPSAEEQNAMRELKELERRFAIDKILLEYACHENPRIRQAGRDAAIALYADRTQHVGEAASNVMKAQSRVLRRDANDKLNADDLAYCTRFVLVAYMAAEHDRTVSSEKGGSPSLAEAVLGEFMVDKGGFFAESEIRVTDAANEKRVLNWREWPGYILAPSRLLSWGELMTHGATLEKGQVPVEYCDPIAFKEEDLRALVAKAKTEAIKAETKNKILVTQVHDGEHYVSVLISGGDACVLDTAGNSTLGKRVNAMLSEFTETAITDPLVKSVAVSEVSNGIQDRKGDDPGLPNGCGLFGFLLHEWLTKKEVDPAFQQLSLLKKVAAFSAHFEKMAPSEKRDQNTVMRARIFNSCTASFA